MCRESLADGRQQKEGKGTRDGPGAADPFGASSCPPALHSKSEVLFPLPNGIFKSETQCSPTESTNVQLRDKWGIKEHIT